MRPSIESQVVTALPDVLLQPRAADDLCVVLASDGLFGTVMSNEQVATCVRQQLEDVHASALDAEMRTARTLADLALCEYQSSDNVSIVIVALEPPLPPIGDLSAAACGGIGYGDQSGASSALGGMIPSPLPPACAVENSLQLAWRTRQISQDSQNTEVTAEPSSPSRRPEFDRKLRQPFSDAYRHVLDVPAPRSASGAGRRSALNSVR